MKIICVHHRLDGVNSHRYNEACGLLEMAAQGRFELLLIANIHADENIAALNARRVMVDPTFCKEWSFEERTRRFATELHQHVDGELNAGDCVLTTVATQLEANGIAAWLRELPESKKPWIIVLMLADRWNWGGRDEYERQMAEFSTLREKLRALSSADMHRLIFCSAAKELSDELTRLMEVPVSVSPMTKAYDEPSSHIHIGSRPRVALLGGTRQEKGARLITDIIMACKERADVDFLVQSRNDAPAPQELVALAEKEPGLELLHGYLSREQYNAALQSSDIILLPYEPMLYRKRTSGIFTEAVAHGKIVIAPEGTWMAQCIRENRAIGVVVDRLDPASYADAIARCAGEIDLLLRKAEEMSIAWRKMQGLPAFIDFVEREIALREKSMPLHLQDGI